MPTLKNKTPSKATASAATTASATGTSSETLNPLRAKGPATSASRPPTDAPSKSASTPAQRRVFSHDEIAARAHSIWETNGRPDGRDQEFWLEAERQLKREDERRFADSDELLDIDGNPADEIDRRLNEIASPPGSRGATSLDARNI